MLKVEDQLFFDFSNFGGKHSKLSPKSRSERIKSFINEGLNIAMYLILGTAASIVLVIAMNLGI
ncbi:hypothetical protein GF357_04915 [Candidatus Dojkabacteria bacterium]|nr:hypothetical protein [Candidatus Dojkabacteria bacterium]